MDPFKPARTKAISIVHGGRLQREVWPFEDVPMKIYFHIAMKNK
jgi:hypothetical protein